MHWFVVKDNKTRFESDEFGGFTLMSLGKLESQRYCTSLDSVKKLKEFQTELLHFKDNFIYIMDDEKYKFPRKFKYLNFAYLNGDLTEVLDSKLKKPCKVKSCVGS